MTVRHDMTVAQIVRDDYRTADVFRKYGINYCCGGDLPYEEACNKYKVDTSRMDKELEEAVKTIKLSNNIKFDAWPVDFLVDYIIYVHHAYVKETLPQLKSELTTFVASHRDKYPELENVLDIFNDLAAELDEHLEEEETKIFPYLKQIFNSYKRRESYGKLFVRTMGKPISVIISADHRRIAALLQELRKATKNYQFVKDACTNYQVIFHKLREFDDDLVRHKHLENNLLFPKVQAMEKELLQIS